MGGHPGRGPHLLGVLILLSPSLFHGGRQGGYDSAIIIPVGHVVIRWAWRRTPFPCLYYNPTEKPKEQFIILNHY